jgi:hypothetical protein
MTRVPPHISPSQIATSRQCRRRWWFEKVKGLTSPGTAATVLGSTLHAVVEGYLLSMNEEQLAAHIQKSVPTTTAANIKQAKRLLAVAIVNAVLPRPGQGLVEKEMLIPFPPMKGGLMGRLDHVDLSNVDEPVVTDHKTTSDPAFAKTEEALRNDPQAILYAQWALMQCPDAPRVRVKYIYYLTRGGDRVWTVDIVLTREEVLTAFREISEEISEMVAAYGEDDPGKLPFKMSSCNSYGRPCPAIGQCPAHVEPDAPPTSGLARLRALSRGNALASSTPTTTAAYAAIQQESNMSLVTIGQLKIALNRFSKVQDAAGVPAEVRAQVQEDVLADLSLVSALPQVSARLKSLDASTPANPVGQVTQWLLDECERRIASKNKAANDLAAATAPQVFEDDLLTDEQAELKDMLAELGYPETEAHRIAIREADRGTDIVANAIRYTGTDDEDEAAVVVPEEPVATKTNPLQGRAVTGKAVVESTPAPAVEPEPVKGAFSELIASLSAGSNSALIAMQRTYPTLEGDDLTTVDGWLTGRQVQVGKGSLKSFLEGFGTALSTSDLEVNNAKPAENVVKEVYAAQARVFKDTARVRDIHLQMPAIVLLFGGSMTPGGGFVLPFREGAVAAPVKEVVASTPKEVVASAPKVAKAASAAPAPKPTVVEPEETGAPARLVIYLDVAIVRGAYPNALPLADVFMGAVMLETEKTGKDPRLEQYGSALKPVALAVSRDVAACLGQGSSIDLFVESTSQSWKLCGDELTAMADAIVRGF